MIKEIQQITRGTPTSDGAGVKMTRLIGTSETPMLDPFLMLDFFGTENPDDYIGGFPAHPHRGFETMTYMLAGHMRHEDNHGNIGVLKPGGVQWMTAGKGIVHSEMPQQVSGEMRGIQLWINLPSYAKMSPPGYQDYEPEQVPVEKQTNGSQTKVIVGTTDHGTIGPVINEFVHPLFMDVHLVAGDHWRQTVHATDNSFIYVIHGTLIIGEQQQTANKGSLVILTAGDTISLQAGQSDSRFIVASAQPIQEPIARGGPFVMNTQAEIKQAFEDFRQGRF
jgi:redox-sensitive bicupin YhaK (pirin superfamily)